MKIFQKIKVVHLNRQGHAAIAFLCGVEWRAVPNSFFNWAHACRALGQGTWNGSLIGPRTLWQCSGLIYRAWRDRAHMEPEAAGRQPIFFVGRGGACTAPKTPQMFVTGSDVSATGRFGNGLRLGLGLHLGMGTITELASPNFPRPVCSRFAGNDSRKRFIGRCIPVECNTRYIGRPRKRQRTYKTGTDTFFWVK